MNISSGLGLVLTLCNLAVLIGGGLGLSAWSRARVEALRADLGDLHNRFESAQIELKSAETKLGQAESRLATSATLYDALEAKYDRVIELNVKLQADNRVLADERRDLLARLDLWRAELEGGRKPQGGSTHA